MSLWAWVRVPGHGRTKAGGQKKHTGQLFFFFCDVSASCLYLPGPFRPLPSLISSQAHTEMCRKRPLLYVSSDGTPKGTVEVVKRLVVGGR